MITVPLLEQLLREGWFGTLFYPLIFDEYYYIYYYIYNV